MFTKPNEFAEAIAEVRERTGNMDCSIYIHARAEQILVSSDVKVSWCIECYHPTRIEAKGTTMRDALEKFVQMFKVATSTPDSVDVRLSLSHETVPQIIDASAVSSDEVD
jgi:hypothetical protein